MLYTAHTIPTPDKKSVAPLSETDTPVVFPKHFVQLSFARFITDTLLLWAIAVVLLTGVYYYHNVAIMAFVFIANGILQNAFGILAHDAIHYRVHSNKKTNDWFTRFFITAPITFPLTLGRINHLNHHKYIGTSLDRDRYYHQTKGKETPLKVAQFFMGALFMVSFAKIAIKILTPKKVMMKQEGSVKSSNNIHTLYDVMAILLVQCCILYAYTTLTGSWVNYFVLWILPLYTVSVFLNTVRSFCEHAIPIPDDIADQNRMITHTSNFFERVLVAPFGMNYHAEHHLYTAVPYYHLKALYVWLRQNHTSVHITYKQFYWQSIIDFAKNVKNNLN